MTARGFDPLQPRDRDGRWSGGPDLAALSSMAGVTTLGADGVPVTDSGERPMTDEEFAARRALIERTVMPLRATHSTDVTQTSADGAWLPERDAIHREIAAELYAKGAGVPRQGRAVIAGGLNGAGKTTVLTRHAGIDPADYLAVNPDDGKEELSRRGLAPSVPGGEELSPMERSVLMHEESTRISKLVADLAYKDRRNIIWDITASREAGLRERIDALRRHGYTEIRGVFVDIPPEVSVTRALARYRRGADRYRAGVGNGGRYVPPSIIRGQQRPSGRTKNWESFDAVRGLFDDWSTFDNSVPGRAPLPIARST